MYQEKSPWLVNYYESEIPPYTLPELLQCSDGSRVTTVTEWEQKRRPELLQIFKDFMYGDLPPMPDKVKYEQLSPAVKVFDGLGTRQEIRIVFQMNNGTSHAVTMLLYLPSTPGPHPVFSGLTFAGNHSLELDERITVTGTAGEGSSTFKWERGSQRRRFPLQVILQRNYALATVSYHDFFPDLIDGWSGSIYKLFYPAEVLRNRPAGRSAISAWAWGNSRMLDCLETLPEIDGSRAAVYGLSRLGKTSLWTGVNDERFKLTCVTDAGCGGSALSRRLYGETLYSMYQFNNFGYFWFSDRLEEYALHPEQLPFDQHELIALAAPRGIAIHSATNDLWADPASEYSALYHAGKLYELYGIPHLQSNRQPSPDTPVSTGKMGYMLRTGKHDMLLEDWLHYLDMADQILI